MKVALTLLLLVLLLSTCTRVTLNDYKHKYGIDLRFCNIKTWTDTHGDELRTNVFTYDEHGNPVSVTSDHEGTGSGWHYFRYDEHQRLSEYEHQFSQTKFFNYDGVSRKPTGARIVDVYGRELAETYTYDEKDRIIRSVIEFVSSPFEEEDFPTETRDYIYVNDDLQSILINGEQHNPEVTYTTKPSIYRTNKVWMLVNHNYSKHSTINVANTNRIGLPAAINQVQFEFPFLDIESSGSTIIYNCR